MIGALAPSSLSVHWAARFYHEALVRELMSGRHERLGDAVLAAQGAYVESRRQAGSAHDLSAVG